MNDEQSSIIEFSEDISTTEKPNPLPVGEYRAEIREAQQKMSQKGNKYAAISLFVDTNQYPADYADGNPDGTILGYNRLMLTDNKLGRYRIRQFFENLGLPAPTRSVDLNTLVGLGVKIRVEHREYEGSPQADVKSVGKAG